MTRSALGAHSSSPSQASWYGSAQSSAIRNRYITARATLPLVTRMFLRGQPGSFPKGQYSAVGQKEFQVKKMVSPQTRTKNNIAEQTQGTSGGSLAPGALPQSRGL